jgi:hypothetical protein
MRRTYISAEFLNQRTYGTFNMVEEANYFGSKMLEIEDSIYLENQSLIYFQKQNGEQIDISSESSLDSILYSAANSKQINHVLTIDESQSSFQKDNNTTWIIDFDMRNILTDFIFATLKRFRTFEGMKAEMTRTGDVNTAIREYIKFNVLNRYRYKRLDLYIQYKDLRKQNVLRYKNNWNVSSQKPENKFVKFQSDLAYDDSKLKIIFNQEKSSKDYTFEYFYNILFEKI